MINWEKKSATGEKTLPNTPSLTIYKALFLILIALQVVYNVLEKNQILFIALY